LIELEGQAFFDVFKDPTKPFLVKCRDLEVEAMGTSFDVNGYDDSPIQVSLLTGKVKLSLPMISENNEEIFLLPGEYSVLGDSNEFIEKGKFDSYEVLAWKEGRLIFDNVTMGEIIPKLELWYGVVISNQMSANLRKPFNGTFEKENLDNILLNMAGPLQFDYEIKGNKIFIKN
jgi:ferric-dicitrate binding protein FerR (iron transport regulator)